MKNIIQSLFESSDMISIDGIMHHRNNSLGEPIHSTDEGIKNFYRWFKGSTAIDELGRPLVLFHGSPHEFDEFNSSRFGSHDAGWLGKGHYFTNDESYASSYGGHKPYYVNVKNPLKLNEYGYSFNPTRLHNEYNVKNSTMLTNKLIEKGHDAVHLSYKDDDDSDFHEINVFSPSQIKIADGSNHTFHSNSKLHESVIKVGNIEKEVVHQPNFSYSYDENDNKQYNELVNVNVNKFDELFKKSDYYIGHLGKGQIKNRYENFGHWFNHSKDALHAPYVSFNDKEPEFTNGRHRYAWLRDNGVKTIPMTMNKVDKEKAIKFGLVDY